MTARKRVRGDYAGGRYPAKKQVSLELPPLVLDKIVEYQQRFPVPASRNTIICDAIIAFLSERGIRFPTYQAPRSGPDPTA